MIGSVSAVRNWTIDALCGAVDGTLIGDGGETFVTSASIDSRRIGPGGVFVALEGERTDGHAHVASAFSAGAAAAIVDESKVDDLVDGPLVAVKTPLGALQAWAQADVVLRGIEVVGVTGTNGKTTTKEMIFAALGGEPDAGRSIGNYNNQIGLPLSVLGLEPAVRLAVLEMGMSTPGEIARLVEIASPRVAVITNVSPAHLDGMGNLDGVLEAKLEILRDGPELAVLPSDQPEIIEAARVRLADRTRVVTFGLEDGADLRAVNIVTRPDGITEFEVVGRGHALVGITGSHNVRNALSAIAVAEYFDRPWPRIRAALASAVGVPMRGERLIIGGFTVINDAYNANPASMACAISMLAAEPGEGRRVLVLGDMMELGPRSEDYHRGVGAAADGAGIDLLLTCGTKAAEITRAATRLAGAGAAMHFDDQASLAAYLGRWLRTGDTVLIKGSRSTEMERVIDLLAHPGKES